METIRRPGSVPNLMPTCYVIIDCLRTYFWLWGPSLFSSITWLSSSLILSLEVLSTFQVSCLVELIVRRYGIDI